ncbi:MAG: type II secretion system protein, partial [Limisphaerales bacterium]
MAHTRWAWSPWRERHHFHFPSGTLLRAGCCYELGVWSRMGLLFHRSCNSLPFMKFDACPLRTSGRRLSNSGFTLIELLVVIAIIAILAG